MKSEHLKSADTIALTCNNDLVVSDWRKILSENNLSVICGNFLNILMTIKVEHYHNVNVIK